MGKTTIEWTSRPRPDGSMIPGYTYNPWWGCIYVSPGCENCYAETFDRRIGGHHWGPAKTTPRRLFGPSHWREPKKWNAEAEAAGERRIVFCASMADVFEDNDQIDGERAKLWTLIHETPWLDWLLLTKRPANLASMVPWGAKGTPWPNVWLGTSVESQKYADERIPLLLSVPAEVRFLSCEPLLGAVDIRPYLWPVHPEWPSPFGSPEEARAAGAEVRYRRQGLVLRGTPFIDWVITGGESGPSARPMHFGWSRSLRDQCRNAGASFFFKQRGAWEDLSADPTKTGRRSSVVMLPTGEIIGAGDGSRGMVEGDWRERDAAWLVRTNSKGEDLSEIPEDLRIREFPRDAVAPREVAAG